MIALLAVAVCFSGPLADRTCTPGATFHVSTKTVCTPGYSAAAREVTYAARRRVFAAYGVPWASRDDYELDHLISLELGGSNADTNLWPQKHPGSFTKDKLENAMHRAVCAGRMTLRQAQAKIVAGWSRR